MSRIGGITFDIDGNTKPIDDKIAKLEKRAEAAQAKVKASGEKKAASVRGGISGLEQLAGERGYKDQVKLESIRRVLDRPAKTQGTGGQPSGAAGGGESWLRSAAIMGGSMAALKAGDTLAGIMQAAGVQRFLTGQGMGGALNDDALARRRGSSGMMLLEHLRGLPGGNLMYSLGYAINGEKTLEQLQAEHDVAARDIAADRQFGAMKRSAAEGVVSQLNYREAINPALQQARQIAFSYKEQRRQQQQWFTDNGGGLGSVKRSDFERMQQWGAAAATVQLRNLATSTSLGEFQTGTGNFLGRAESVGGGQHAYTIETLLQIRDVMRDISLGLDPHMDLHGN